MNMAAYGPVYACQSVVSLYSNDLLAITRRAIVCVGKALPTADSKLFCTLHIGQESLVWSGKSNSG